MGEELVYLSNIKRSVLVVDDEEINREILGGILEESYDVLYATNGEEALNIVEKKGPLLSLVLLDLMMPVMDGFAVMEKMQQDVVMRNIPIIVLTSEESAEIESLRKGAADFIKKPYDMPEKIMARVRRIIALFEDRMIIQSTEKDELTGLLSQSYFYEYASLQDKFNPGRKMDAVTVNINHFHLYNELYGMSEGDLVLKRIADGLKSFAEKTGGIAGRSDADNFSLYVPHQESYEKLVEDISESIRKDSNIHNTSIRIGVNDLIDDEDNRLEMAFDRARMAADSVNGNTTSVITYYDAAMRKQRMFEERLIRDIADGIIKNQFKVFYQSKYDITGDAPKLAGAEALVRWEHPEFGMIYPGSFISVFEENGLIQLMDDYIWRQAAAQVKKWKDKYHVTIPISVNVSRIDIQDENIVSNMCDIVKEAGIDVKDLHLEITESAYTSDTDQLVEVVAQFREKGFVIEMDDFGSGYSSLNMLTTLPIDILKVDMRFMQSITQDKKSLRMMELVKEIADFLNVPVVAEGVEEKEQLDTLKELGCQMIQGYYFSKPLPVSEFESFIK